ncbi:MAG: phosphatase PAP2 family protein [Burkholderiaceae bacterium]
MQDALVLVDAGVADWFHGHAVPGLTLAMLVITHIHSLLSIGIFAAVLACFLIRKRDWYWLLALVLAVPGGMLLNMLAKHVFERARPSFSDPILVLASYSFPSGHVVASTVFYGLLGTFLVSKIDAWRWRALVVLLAFVMVVLVALSRVYLGVHYLSDVLAGFAEGVVWLAICFTALHFLPRALMGPGNGVYPSRGQHK